MEYMIQTTAIKNKPGEWNSLQVEIYGDNKKIGEYTRNYSSFYKTFLPFKKNSQDYALYSKDYTATRVMSLPSCQDVAGEERNSFGFCPVEFYVPDERGFEGQFGFVAGCMWGDDTSWKVQLLDLRKIEEGKLQRIDFDYHELPENVALCNAFNYHFILKNEMEFEIQSAPRSYFIDVAQVQET